MLPTIVEKGPMILVGFSFFGDPFQVAAGWSEENEIGRLWSRWIAYLANNRGRIKHVRSDAVHYELMVEHEATRRTGEFEVFAGLEVADLEDLPVEVTVKALPAATYAVFTFHGAEITSDWTLLMTSEWLPQAGYQPAYPYNIQVYDERFKGMDRIQESVLDVYIPVVRCSDG